jgi:hypothetical protein
VKVTQEISTNPCTSAASGASEEDLNGSAHSASFDSAAAAATAADGTATDTATGATANGHKALVTLPPPLLQREVSNQSMSEYTVAHSNTLYTYVYINAPTALVLLQLIGPVILGKLK